METRQCLRKHLEIFGGNVSFVINDFRSGTLFRNNKETNIKNTGKGHQQEVAAFLSAVKEGREAPISFESIYTTTLVTLKILDSLSTGLPQDMNVETDAVDEIKPILNGNGSSLE
jgi:polar amino acid transport system substrate-binding protein